MGNGPRRTGEGGMMRLAILDGLVCMTTLAFLILALALVTP